MPLLRGNEVRVVRVKEIPALGAVQTFEYIPFYVISVGELCEIPAASLLILFFYGLFIFILYSGS